MENPHPKSFINKRKRFNDYKVLGRKKRYESNLTNCLRYSLLLIEI